VTLRSVVQNLLPWNRANSSLPAPSGKASQDLAPAPTDSATIDIVQVNYYKSRLARRGRRAWRVFLVTVVGPTLLAAGYYGFIASDRYVSEARLVVNGDSDDAGGGDSNNSNPLMSLIRPGTISVNGTIVLYNYIQSMDMMDRLDKAIDMRSRFSIKEADWLSRLSPDATNEEFMDYFQRRVQVIGEPNNPVLTVRVEAFSPKDAHDIMLALVSISEQRLNALLLKRQEDMIGFAKSELAKAEQRLLDAQTRITNYRTEHSEIDPIQAATAIGGITASIEQALASQRAALASMLMYLKPDNPAVQATKARIKGLEQQLNQTRTTLAGKDQTTYAALVSEFETLKSEEALAQQEYSYTLEFLTVARGDAQRQHAYVTDFVAPNMPEEATEPHRIRAVATVFIICCLAFGIGTMVMTAVREQSGV
jgi:capsular polysaccharide transport system permease protein